MDQPTPTDRVPSECPNCKGAGIVPDAATEPELAQFAAACGALPGDDCPNCEGRGILDAPGDQPSREDLDAMAGGMIDGLALYLGDEDGCR